MTNTQLISKYISVQKGDITGKCKVCGSGTTSGFKAKDYIKESRFTNNDCLKEIDSDVICENCAACLKDDSLRRSSFICSESGLVYLKKNDIENYLFDLDKYVKGEFVVCITKSFKKHNSFRARVNLNPHVFYIREEDDEYIFDSYVLKDIYKAINRLYLYFAKEDIQTAHYDTKQIIKYGKEQFFIDETIIKPFRGSKQFELLLHMLNSERRNEIVKKRIKEEKENAKLKRNGG